jgi:hypothetical protein
MRKPPFIKFFLVSLFLITFHNLWAQNDSLQSGSKKEENDTIIIQKDPLFIVKTVYIEDNKIIRNSESWVEPVIAILFNSNKFIPCPSFENYVNSIKTSTSKSKGYSAGITYNYLYKHLFLSAGFGIISYHEKFNFSGAGSGNNIQSENIYNYVDFYTSAGYKVQLRKSYCIFNIGLISRKLLSISGKTIATDFSEIDLQNAKQFSVYSISGLVGVKLISNLPGRLKIIIEPFFCKTLQTLTRDLIPFIERRNAFGIKAGVAIAL